MTGLDDPPELADVGRLARKLVGRAVRTARQEDQPLRRALLEHLGPDAAHLPTVSDTCPLYEHVNVQVGMDAWLAADPRRTYEVVGITGVGLLRHTDVSVGDIIQSASQSAFHSAGVGAPVTQNLPCGPDGQTRACVTNGLYLVRDGDDRLVIMFVPNAIGRRAEVTLQVVGTSQEKAEQVLREIWRLARERSVFRGQVISFGPEVFGPGGDTTPLNFLPRPRVGRDQVILPGMLLDEIERQVIGVARLSGRLLANGQHLKRGILLHGPPSHG
jgi:hypothetical protein